MSWVIRSQVSSIMFQQKLQIGTQSLNVFLFTSIIRRGRKSEKNIYIKREESESDAFN